MSSSTLTGRVVSQNCNVFSFVGGHSTKRWTATSYPGNNWRRLGWVWHSSKERGSSPWRDLVLYGIALTKKQA